MIASQPDQLGCSSIAAKFAISGCQFASIFCVTPSTIFQLSNPSGRH